MPRRHRFLRSQAPRLLRIDLRSYAGRRVVRSLGHAWFHPWREPREARQRGQGRAAARRCKGRAPPDDERSDRHLIARMTPQADRKSVVKGKSVSVRVDLGDRRIVKKKKNKDKSKETIENVNMR